MPAIGDIAAQAYRLRDIHPIVERVARNQTGSNRIKVAERLRTYRRTGPVARVSLHHTHDSSWPESVDWLELRNHLVNTHREREADIDDFKSYLDGTTGRRRHAEDRHSALHFAPLHPYRG